MDWLTQVLMWAMIAANYYAYCLRKNLTIPELRDTVTNFMVWFNLANVAIALLIFVVAH
jgi:hypothetical protein